MELRIHHDEIEGKFHADVEGGEARLSYRRLGEDRLDFMSTFVPPASRGKGVAEAIVQSALGYARAQGLKVIPTCWYVDAYLESHPQEADLRA